MATQQQVQQLHMVATQAAIATLPKRWVRQVQHQLAGTQAAIAKLPQAHQVPLQLVAMQAAIATLPKARQQQVQAASNAVLAVCMRHYVYGNVVPQPAS